MTDLERRALLGDKQAQEECTRRGIVLTCPLCGRAVTTRIRPEKGAVTLSIICVECRIERSVRVEMIDAEFRKIENEINKLVNDWNTRPAPPIGRCGECKHLGERTVHETGEKENFCNHDQYGLFALDSTNAYCSYFEPKERSEQ